MQSYERSQGQLILSDGEQQSSNNGAKLKKKKKHQQSGGLWSQVRSLLIAVLALQVLVELLSNHNNWHERSKQEFNSGKRIREALNGSSEPAVEWIAGRIMRLVIMVAAADSYAADATAESPTTDALDDDDDDDEELDASASNEYPDGENDNDESYDDSDDERQESRRTESWAQKGNGYQVHMPAPLSIKHLPSVAI